MEKNVRCGKMRGEILTFQIRDFLDLGYVVGRSGVGMGLLFFKND